VNGCAEYHPFLTFWFFCVKAKEQLHLSSKLNKEYNGNFKKTGDRINTGNAGRRVYRC